MTEDRRGPARDRVVLRGLHFYGYHGVNPEEQKLGQRFRVDLTVWADLSRAAASDDLADTISYAEVYEAARAVMEGAPSRLLEHVAGRIGGALLRDARVERARVRILKLGPPIPHMDQGAAGVDLEFRR
jgi:7,8-dihydroneopterin aldolase/epimerase/oxygenase